MATSSSEIRKRKDKLRHEILSYKPGMAVTCKDKRVVFPEKLVVGMFDLYGYAPDIVHTLRRVLYVDVEPIEPRPADKPQTSTVDQEEYLTDSVSVIMTYGSATVPEFDKYVHGIAEKVRCMVLFVNPTYVSNYTAWIGITKEITGRAPLCAMFTSVGSEVMKGAKHELKKQGVNNIYQVPYTDEIPSDGERLQWLDLIHGCLCEADVVTLYSNPSFQKISEQERKQGKEAGKRHEEEIRERKEDKKLLQRRITDLEQELNESRVSPESIVSEYASSTDTMKVEQERRGVAMTENGNRAKQAMDMCKQREIESEGKLKSKDLCIETVAENLQMAERQVERLQTEHDEMTKKLESKQQRIYALTQIIHEKERNESAQRQEVEDLTNEREEERARFDEKKRLMKKELESKKQCIEQLERETRKLRTKIQLESEMRWAEQTKKAETPQWSFIRWMSPGKQVHDGMSSSDDNSNGEYHPSDQRSNASPAEEEPTNDEFANILKQISDDLSEEAKIDSLGSQLGIIQGDIARALKTNMRYEQITSRGTHLMLKQWRESVSRKDERIEMRRALVAAKLLQVADHYFPPAGGGTGSGQPQKMKDSHQLSGIDSTPSAQGSSDGQTKTRETSTAATDQPLHDKSSNNDWNEQSKGIDQLSKEASNHSIDGDGTPGGVGGVTGLEEPQEKVETQGSSEGLTKTQTTTSTTDQQGTSVDVSSKDGGTDTSDESIVEYITINYSDLLCNIASTETSSEKLLMLLFMKVIIDVPHKTFGG